MDFDFEFVTSFVAKLIEMYWKNCFLLALKPKGAIFTLKPREIMEISYYLWGLPG